VRAQVFALTWVSYASYYLCRKGLAVSKERLSTELGLSLDALAAIDTGYLAAYAGGMIASGLICDVSGPRRLIGAGMVVSAAATAAFGACSTSAAFAIAFTVNGLAQSTGWPGNVKAMTPWFAPSERGRVMGLWATCYQLGGLIATALATWLLAHHGWRAAFVVPAIWTGAIGVAVLLLLREPPPAPVERRRFRPRLESLRALASPRAWNLGLAYFCLKLIRYSLLFWLPLYLHRALGYKEASAGYQSLSFELGGAAGALVTGVWSDRVSARRGIVMVAMAIGLALSLALYINVAALGAAANFAGLALVGFMLFGPDALVSSTAAQDLGGVEAAGTAAGIINGVGSIGAILQGTLTTVIVARYGWPALFRVFIGLASCCALVLVPVAWRRRAQ